MSGPTETIRSAICCYAQHASAKIAWQITDRCHLRCPYCFTPDLRRRDRSLRDATAIVDRLKTMFPAKDRLLFAGREPLLYPHIMEVAQYAAANGYLCSLSTSGELLDSARAEAMQRAGIYKVNVTINASESEEHRRSRPGGSLKRVVAGIRAAKLAGLVTKVNITATPATSVSVPGTLRLLHDLAVDRITIGLLHPAAAEDAVSLDELRRQVAAFQSGEWRPQPITLIAPPSSQPCSAEAACPVRAGFVSVLPDGRIVGCNIYPNAFEVTDDGRILDGHARAGGSASVRVQRNTRDVL